MSPDLVVLGNLLVDDVVLPDGRTRMGEPGGATLYAALGASLWGVSVGAVTWRGDDYPGWALDALAARGVDTAGVRPLGRPGLRTWLLYEGRRRRVVHRLEGPSHAEASPGPDAVPPGWEQARAFHLAPMPMDVQRALVTALGGREATVSVDPHVPITAETLTAWREILRGVDAVFVGEDDLELPADDEGALQRIAGGRLRNVFFKRGARGGLACDLRDGTRIAWPPRVETVTDATGAGDAFAGGVLAGWLRGDALERAVQRGVVSASFAIEDWGPASILGAAPRQAEERLREWFGR